jgi:hypothetical protein
MDMKEDTKEHEEMHGKYPKSEEKACREGAKKRRRTKRALEIADENRPHADKDSNSKVLFFLRISSSLRAFAARFSLANSDFFIGI